MPLVDVVTGSFNRIAYLQAMIQSVRDQMPRHLPARFIVVDGGSTDGTIAWCEQQSDIMFIGHGELRGAIAAFCDGARASDADYTILANDDITFHPLSILRAISHLEEHRTCGVVAFADNRHSQSIGENPQHYRVMSMQAVGVDGNPASVLYAQVGMFRNWLGRNIDWWGCSDAIMRKARTYGADNWASAAVWNLGYSVDAVPGCTIDDFIPPDAMRTTNVSGGPRDSAQYYVRWPRGPQLQPYPMINNPDRERLRVIVMDAHARELPARTAKEKGLAEAFAEIGLVVHIDYLNETYDLPQMVRAWQPHLLITQMHQPNEHLNQQVFQAARDEKPDVLIVNFNGDAHERGLIDAETIEALREVDLQTVVNAKVLPTYKRKRINAAYWQIGYKPAAEPIPDNAPRHTVLFQGNEYSDERRALVQALRETGLEVGLYGSIPGADGNTHFSFAKQEALNLAAMIVVGDTFPETIGYVSNRLFQVLGAGAFLLQQVSAKLDKYTGLRAGVHYAEWTDLEDLKAKCAYWSRDEMANKRREIAEAGQAFVLSNFSYSAQVRKLWDLIAA